MVYKEKNIEPLICNEKIFTEHVLMHRPVCEEHYTSTRV